MSSAPAGSDPVAHARLQGKRAALGAVIVVAVAFIGASAVQIIPAVFGARIRPIPRGAAGAERTCAVGVRDLAGAVIGRGSAVPAERSAEIERACTAFPQGEDAWAAFQRLSLTSEQLHGRDPSALEPLVDDLAKHLPADLR
jgi:hypothetical protein